MLQMFCFRCLHCLVYFKPTILSCFFFYILFLIIFYTSPVDNENVRLRLARVIPTGVPITVANNAIEMLPPFADNTII